MEVRAESLSMHFNDAGRDVEVISNLSFAIESGNSVAIVGESGVGKTTLLYILGGLEHPSSGEVFIGGESLTAKAESGEDLAPFRGKNLSFIFQSHHLLPEFDAVENAAMPLLIRGVDEKQARATASELLTKVGLGHRLTHRPGALSGGEQQRVAIARSLVGNPGVVLADEPTGNLDVRTGAKVVEQLLELHRERRFTLILVTHSLELAGMLDRVVELTPSGLTQPSRQFK